MTSKKEALGYSMILVGSLIVVLLFLFTNDVPVTGNFLANEKFSNSITIDKFNVEYNSLTLTYSLDKSYFDQDVTKIDIWILNDMNYEVRRIKDNFQKSEYTGKDILIDLSTAPAGSYTVYIAPSNNLDNYIKREFILGRSSTTGLSILDNSRNKMIAYGIFLLIIAIGVVLIFLSSWKKKEKNLKGKVLKKKKK